ncbi:class III chitinase [Diplogelasinospora grovesii]|uniref:Class III chitinase n=1 Tax=Diplogelasinospora grovesii TaxID=303347 RepID=A0AAN6S9V8_9PEZI|nr:class III chitinase [Diplogelasinospora grovesii]
MPPVLITSIITYYQTHHDSVSGKHISVLPLVQQPGISLTHLIVAAIHVNEDPRNITLNDHHPSHARFQTLWAELRILQATGIKVLGMVGGAAKGSFARLDVSNPDDRSQLDRFETYYQPLHTLIKERGLDGLDLDVEEPMSLGGVVFLIDRLRRDFGPGFIITLAPVAAALLNPRHNLSGFDYEALEVMRGGEIAWYNAQFYCGWGDCSNPVMYEMILMKGWPAEKVVVGLVTNPENGDGWVPWSMISSVLPLLVGRHARFGGVMGWEYFNSLPGGRERPWEWAGLMSGWLRGRGHEQKDMDMTELLGGKTGLSTGVVVVVADEDGEADEVLPVPRGFEYYSDGIEEDDE